MSADLKAIIDGLPGVTDGEWFSAGGYVTVRDPGGRSFSRSIYDLDEMGQETQTAPFQAVPFAKAKDAAHIARCSPPVMRRIAADFAALEARVKELETALEPFAEAAEHDIGSSEHDLDLYKPMSKYNRAPNLVVGDLRRARAALRKGASDE